jgi:hypothetical protein
MIDWNIVELALTIGTVVFSLVATITIFIIIYTLWKMDNRQVRSGKDDTIHQVDL